jgi:AI-2 transport protein TqsA
MTTSGVDTDSRWSLPRGLIVVLSMTGLLVSVLALKEFAGIIAPVLLALVLVICFHPLIGILRRRGAPLWLAVTVTLLALVAVVLGMAVSLGLSVARLATILPTYQAQFNQLLNDLRGWLASLGVGQDQIKEAFSKINFSSVAGLLSDVLAGVAGVFSNLLLLLFVVAFMVLDAVRFSRRLASARPERPEIVGALDSFVAGTRTYLLVSTIFGLIVAVIDAGFLWLVDVPLPVLWGMLAFITNYIPNVGFIVGIVPPALLGLLQGGPKLMITVIIGYSLINFVIQSVIQPKVMADAVNLSLTLTFVSLIFWTFVIGAMGAILAVPLTLLTKALLLDVDPSTRWISGLITGGPAPPEGEVDDVPAPRAAPKPDSDEVAAQGTAAQGTAAQGTAAQGTAAQGTAAQGTAAQGTAAEGAGPRDLALAGEAQDPPRRRAD